MTAESPRPDRSRTPGPAVPRGYGALRDAAAWVDLSPREATLVWGDDAVRFVDGFCTAPLATTAVGAGTEAFFPDARGQVLAWGTVLRAADGVWIDVDPAPGDAEPAGPAALAAHLERYHIRERLEIVAAGRDWTWLLVAGPEAVERLARGGLRLAPGAPIAHDVETIAALAAGQFPARLAGAPVAAARGEWAGPGSCLLVADGSDRARLLDWLAAEGIVPATAEALDAVRREERRPAPADIPPRTLPQELGRDRRAISFHKGCYLGQETVARLDALGHVNRLLAGIALEGPVAPGAVVESEEGAVGTITSSGVSPRHGGWLALGLLRVAAARPGTALRVAGMAARVVSTGPTEEAA